MPVLLERSRPTKDQLRAVHAYIRRQREKGKQALAESKAKEEEEKQRKREEQKKKETVEDVKKEIAELEAKLERLKQKKHDLFSQFKKALNHEDEMRKQQELQAMKAAASVHVTSSRVVQGLPVGQTALTPTVHPQSALVDAASSSGVIKRQGSPPHPLSSFIQAQITHSQKIQNIQPTSHVPYPPQTTQIHPVSQERFAGFQHGQGQLPVIAGSQPDSRLPGKHHTTPLATTGTASDSQPPFARHPPQGGLPQQENQPSFSTHQLQQQHQQQFPYHVQQQQSSYQQYSQHGSQKQAFQTSGPHTQTQQPLPSSAQHNQGPQHGYPAQHAQDQGHLQSYHGNNVHQAQQSYQMHSQPQGYQAKPPPVTYQAQHGPMSGQHAYHPQQPQQQQQQQQPLSGQYPVAHGHQGQHDQLHRQQTIAPQQYQQPQGSNPSLSRQASYEGGHQSQQMPPPQQQHQKQEQRPGTGLGYSQHYTHDYQQHHAQGSQPSKRASHKFSPYPYSGSKGHHQGNTGKKYLAKYQSSVEGTSSSQGSHTGPSGSSSHSRHHHHQSRSHKTGTGTYSSSSQQKPSRYYQ